MIDHSLIAEARASRHLSDVVGQHVQLKRTGSTFSGFCPFHENTRTPAFNVDDKRGTFKCYSCNAWGDAIDFVMMVGGHSFIDAVEQLLGEDVLLPKASQTVRHAVMSADEDETRRRAHAHGVWMRRQPITGTLAATYLHRTRKLSTRIPDQIGFVEEVYCSPLERAVPAMIAVLQDGLGQVTAIQCVYLDEATGDAFRDEHGRRMKRTMGPMKDGAVRLGGPFDTLGIAGSVEDGLAAQQIFSVPVWASCGEGRMSRVGIPDTVARVIIFGDSDEVGDKQARLAKERIELRRRDLEIEIMLPPNAKDWNATL